MKERAAVVAGQFYPSDPDDLRRVITSFFEKPETAMEAMAVVVPHAGYVYSGPVAGGVFCSIRLPKRVILLGPNHTGRGAALALSPPGSWRTPLGAVSVDSEMNRELLAECPGLQEDSSAHAREHSLEVQIPFIQALQPDFRFCAICVGTDDYASLEALGHGMARAIKSLARAIKSPKESVLLVASSDMTHYETAEHAARQDRFAIDQILELDPRGLYQTVMDRDITMCGFAPTIAVIIACLDLGASEGRLIRYTNSGEASGDYRSVVGYAGLTIT